MRCDFQSKGANLASLDMMLAEFEHERFQNPLSNKLNAHLQFIPKIKKIYCP